MEFPYPIGGTFIPWNLRSKELLSLGTFIPKSKISMEILFPNIDHY